MILICVAVRMKSSRCPKKALADLYGEPLILRLHERICEAGFKIVWCTSTHKDDNKLAQLARWHDIECYQGDELDVMGRFLDMAMAYDAKTVVRVTGDNPLTDPYLIKEMVRLHQDKESHYTYVTGPPRGTKPEIIDVDALKALYGVIKPEESEYMTPMLERMKNKAELTVKGEACAPTMRLTCDTPQDLNRLRQIYNHYEGKPPRLPEIITWVKTNLTDYSQTGEKPSKQS